MSSRTRRQAVLGTVLTLVVAVVLAWLAARGCTDGDERPVDPRDVPVEAEPDRVPERVPEGAHARPETRTETIAEATEPTEAEAEVLDPARPTRLVATVVREDTETPVAGALAEARGLDPENEVGGTSHADGVLTASDVPFAEMGWVIAVVPVPGRPTAVLSFDADELSTPPHLVCRLLDVRVEGRCVTTDGTPVEGATIAGGGGSGATTDAEGRFAFRSELEGDHHLFVLPPEHAPHRLNLPEPDSDGVVRVGVVTLQIGGSVAGVVVEPDGSPGFGVTIQLAARHFHQTVAEIVTDMQGRFVFDHVGEGAHLLLVRPRELTPNSIPPLWHEAVAGETALRIVLPKQVPLRVTFIAADTGEPVLADTAHIAVVDTATNTIGRHETSMSVSDG